MKRRVNVIRLSIRLSLRSLRNIASRTSLRPYRRVRKPFILDEMYRHPEIREILDHPVFLSLSRYAHHGNESRLLHVVSVAERAYVMAGQRGLDAVASARAALLHDLYFYDRSAGRRKGHFRRHPDIALGNALKYFRLGEIEADAIANHMWPLTRFRPRFRESRIVALADKASTLLELRTRAGRGLRRAGRRIMDRGGLAPA